MSSRPHSLGKAQGFLPRADWSLAENTTRWILQNTHTHTHTHTHTTIQQVLILVNGNVHV